MKLKVEKWLDKSNFNREVSPLFSDAIKCYKAEAYRAALLFSYLGFLTVLKQRIGAADQPALYPAHKWTALRAQITNEDKWEQAVYDATQECGNPDPTNKKDPVFSISDALRIQIKYWKDRRNDCAHYKDNEINGSYVEVFWTFLESNLSKITVEGGMNSLLNKIRQHFDSSYTRPGTDIAPLVDEIDSSVDSKELSAFWPNVFQLIDRHYHHWMSKDLVDFIKKTLALNNTRLSESLIAFLKSDDGILFSYLGHVPSFVAQLGYDEAHTRNFWNTKLANMNESKMISIYSAMLSNGMIAAVDLDEANDKIVSNTKEYTTEPSEHLILQNHRFGEAIERLVFQSDNMDDYNWTNRRADLILGFVEKYPLSPLAVRKLCAEFDGVYYSYWLARRLDRLFTSDANKKSEFVGIMQAEGLSAPHHLSSLV